MDLSLKLVEKAKRKRSKTSPTTDAVVADEIKSGVETKIVDIDEIPKIRKHLI